MSTRVRDKGLHSCDPIWHQLKNNLNEVSRGGQVLCIQGFLAARKQADRVILLAEMMASAPMPCFKAGSRVLTALRKRFHLALTEAQCVEVGPLSTFPFVCRPAHNITLHTPAHTLVIQGAEICSYAN